MGDIVGSLGEAVVEHPSDDVLDVTSQRMTHARVHVILRHATVECHVRTEMKEEEKGEKTNLTEYRHKMRSGDLPAYLFLNGPSNGSFMLWMLFVQFQP